MLVRNKSAFIKGLVLMGSFLVVLSLIFVRMPMWGTHAGQPMNFLEYADNLFNRLSKGSSYFIPDVQKQVEPLVGTPFEATVTPRDKADAGRIARVLQARGIEASASGNAVTARGDLGAMLMEALADSEAMFDNQGEVVKRRYEGFEARDVLRAWWGFLDPLVKALQQQTLYQPAKVVNTVEKKAVEPAFNFYGIEAQDIGDRWFLVVVLLVFYVIYTMWYGFAIFELFAGIGLTMTKAKVKKEV